MPERWAEKREIKHSGRVDHGSGGFVELTADDLAALSEDDKRDLARILERVKAHRLGADADQGDVVDAEWTEADEDEFEDEPAALPPSTEDPMAGLSVDERQELASIL